MYKQITLTFIRQFPRYILITARSRAMATAAGEVPSSVLQSLYCVIRLRGPQALAFGYFEVLLRLGDASKMLEEAARFRAFEALLHAVGIPDLYEDFIEPTADLLEHQAATLPNHDGGAAILAKFNNDAASSQLTYSFKVGPISDWQTNSLEPALLISFSSSPVRG